MSTDEKVTAEYRDEQGNLLWAEDPYPFKRKFGVGQDFQIGGYSYVVKSARFDGVFGNGKLFYVVSKQKRKP